MRVDNGRVTIWQHMILTAAKPTILLPFPVLQARVAVYDLCDLALIETFAAATTPGFALAMDQPDFAESLPGVFARSEGPPSLGLGVLNLLLADVTLDNLLRPLAQSLFQLGDLLPQ